MPFPFHVPHHQRGRVLMLALMVMVVAAVVAVSVPQASALAGLSPCYSSDNGDPELTSLTVSPDVVDVTEQPVSVGISATVVDTGGPGSATGVRSVVVHLKRSSREFEVHLVESGGVWSGTQKVSPGVRPGDYSIRVIVSDHAKNVSSYEGEDLAGLGVPAAVTVLSHADLAPPTLRAIHFEHRFLDTRRGPRWQALTMKVTDRRTGVARVGVDVDGLGSFDLHRTRSDPTLFRTRLLVPVWLQNFSPGYLYISGVRAYDLVGNQGVWDELDKAGFADDYAFDLLSRPDFEAPRTSALERSRSRLDVRRGPRSLSIGVSAVDEQAGVATVWLEVYRSGRHLKEFRLRRTDGTARHARWSRQLLIDGCTWERGRYQFRTRARDAAGNFGTGGSTTVAIRARETQRPQFQVFDRSLAPGEPLHILFDEEVRGVDTDNAVVSAQADGSRVPGTWLCRDRYTDDVGCWTGRIRSATFTPAAPLTEAAAYTVEFNPEHRLGVTDRLGNPFDRDRERFRVTAL